MALTLCMVVGLFAVTAFAATPKKIYFLGDSVTTAYSTDAYIEHAGYPVLKVVASMDALGQRRTGESNAVTFSTSEQSFVGRTITEILNAAVAAVVRYITMPLTITRVAAKIVGIL